MTAANVAEFALVERLRAGDVSALELLMAQYTDRVFRLARGVTRNAADAEEVVQDVFVRLFAKIGGFDGRAALGTWIYRIAVNLALNKRRGKAKELEVPLENDLPTYKADGHREGERAYVIRDWSRTPEEELLSGEARDILSRALDDLPDTYRAVLVLRDVEGLSNEETAELVGESVASVKSRLHRARMALRERLTRALPRSGSEHASA
jgi:RNA polymerase sigma-70 factor, ECF subfamily